LARELGGRLLDPSIAYVASDRAVPTPFASAYEVLDVAPFQLKRLRASLLARGIGRVVVKRRGFAMEPDALRARLRLPGGGEQAVVVLTRVAGRPSVILCRTVRERVS
ncbi:MAG: SAM-dependent methyltransferase, partial [Actinomycetota bacterium]|nr:SAM-dependent methyltransferase [Actinomycetota bacterium]